MREVYEFLKNCGTYYLATVEGDQPRVRPFGTVDLFDGRLYIQTGTVKEGSRWRAGWCGTTGWRPRPTCWTAIPR